MPATIQPAFTTPTQVDDPIGFESLAKIIGSKWQDLTPDQVEYYKEKAGEDMKRYKKEMEVYLTMQSDKANQASTGGKEEDNSEPAAKKQKL